MSGRTGANPGGTSGADWAGRLKKAVSDPHLGRFLLVGALGTLIDVGLFSLFHLRLGLPVLLANTLSYTAGMINNFALDRAWTFADQPRKRPRCSSRSSL
jgi:putative flippase GtrA